MPELEMNPADADDRKLQTGDLVEVANDRGSFQMKIRANPSIRPGLVKSDVGVAPAYTPKGLIGNVMTSGRVERSKIFKHGPNFCFNDNLVEVKKAGA
jgi:anaerobic selenocysteine-containing dehydrogenase